MIKALDYIANIVQAVKRRLRRWVKQEHSSVRRLYEAISADDLPAVRRLLAEHSELLHYSSVATGSWLHLAAKKSSLEMIEMFLEAGLDLNHEARPAGTPLTAAIDRDRVDVVRHLLERGADPNLARASIAAVNCDSPEAGLEIIKLLVEHGVDVNQSFLWYDDENMPSFTPLTWAEANGKQGIAEYLRAHGAVAPEPKQPAAAVSREQVIVAHFEQQFGPVRPPSLCEIVPTGLPVAIHVVPPGPNHSPLTLFTTGMSAQAMTVPEGSEAYRHAELVIHLPVDWPLTLEAVGHPDHGWPFEWLRNVARWPHDNETWLGGPVAVIPNGEPPKPLSPNNQFVAVLLFAESEMHCQDGRLIQLYTLVPLYREEYELERAAGIGTLFQAFDRAGLERVVDLRRPSVAR